MSKMIQETSPLESARPSIAAPSPTAVTGASLVASVAPPPASANVPPAPAGWSRAAPGEFRNVVPWSAELAALPQALDDLSKFADFDTMFAAMGLTLSEISQCLRIAGLWSTMRASTARWEEYSVLQEGYAWLALRAVLSRLGPALSLAAHANPKLASTYPGLSALLGARRALAHRGAATRRLNQAAKANGEPEIHGVIGKKRQRRAQKAALANATSATPASPVIQPPPIEGSSLAATRPRVP